MCSSGIAAEALLQLVAVETVELQHFSVKGSNKQTESVLFTPLIETRAKPGSIPGLVFHLKPQQKSLSCCANINAMAGDASWGSCVTVEFLFENS